MKSIIVFFSFLLIVSSSFAQSDKYIKSMQMNLGLLESAKSPEDFTSLAASFERIAEAEKSQWLPYYYAALTTLYNGFANESVSKDELANKAGQLIEKAEVLKPDNSDIILLRNMEYTLRMLVDPQSRYMQYVNKIGESLATAKRLDPNNPRVYLIEAQSLFGTPAQFGGGKDKAKPVFEKSIALFDANKPESALHPSWGKSTAVTMLAQCD